MKIVIDISDKIYNDLRARREANVADINTVFGAISGGTVLPEGHGDLIDRNVVYEVFDNADLPKESKVGKLLIFGIPTVIPADKEDNND